MEILTHLCQCGEIIDHKRWRAGKRVCVGCGVAKGIEHNVSMNRKSGPAWDSYIERLRGMIAAESKAYPEEDHASQGYSPEHH